MASPSVAALLAFLSGFATDGGAAPGFFGLRRLRGSKYRPHEGAQERSRRRRQIERGQLTSANGLVRRG